MRFESETGPGCNVTPSSGFAMTREHEMALTATARTSLWLRC